jgi:hypothetical protein
MPNPHVRSLKRAIEILGSKTRLATALEISEEELDGYLEGKPMPTEMFIETLDIVAHGKS